MLGIAPLASFPIAATGALVIAVSGALAASSAFVFSGAPAIALHTPLSAIGEITFGGSPTAYPRVYIGSSGAIEFSGSPILRVAGKPIIITALPDSFSIRAEQQNYTLTVAYDNLTFRGVP